MKEFLEYCENNPMEANLLWTFLNISENTPLEKIRERLLGFAEEALEWDELDQELLKQAAVKELKRLKFPQPRKLIDAAFVLAKSSRRQKSMRSKTWSVWSLKKGVRSE